MIPKSKGINKQMIKKKNQMQFKEWNWNKKKKKKRTTSHRMTTKQRFSKRKFLVSRQYLYPNTLIEKF